MLREFFCEGGTRRRSFAYVGLCVFVSHAVFKSWLKVALNAWYEAFYDVMSDHLAKTDEMDEQGSGISERREDVWRLLADFAILVSPTVLVHPMAKWIGSVWCYTWRVALIESYLSRWDRERMQLEGAAQRVHEDTQRFADGLYSCFALLLDSLFTLVAFVPVLLELGEDVHPFYVVHSFKSSGVAWSPWLLTVAVLAALCGLGVSMIVGHRLVGLDVANQAVEAHLRTNLVLLEQAHSITDDHAFAPSAMRGVLTELWENYRRLYRQFALFNVWLSIYDQLMVLVPYLLAAPLLFAEDPANRITLGTLVKMSNAFGRCFDAMAIVSENWNAVNAWRSVLQRLREFERMQRSASIGARSTRAVTIEFATAVEETTPVQ